jgi:hypothetical protein
VDKDGIIQPLLRLPIVGIIRSSIRGPSFSGPFLCEAGILTKLPEQVSKREVLRSWWPLAASWLLMGAELPALSAVIARLANPQINLAAYGGIVFPLALIIESPIIMLLAASTALSKDWPSYQKLRRFMMVAGAVLTVLHVLVAFTPLYYFVVRGILGSPEEIIEPARLGLMIMTPWTWAIAYRRFNQGVLIRFGHSRTVGVGTVVRLLTNASVLAAGYILGNVPGIIVGASAVALGVTAEAVYTGFVIRPVLRNELRPAPLVEQTITLNSFLVFYIPLALTSLLMLITQPMGSAALSRMPNALASLAAWPVVSGLIFLLRSMGMAYNEVVVAMLDKPRTVASLRSVAYWMAGLTTLGLVLVAATPLSGMWFGSVSALEPELAELARTSLWFGLLLPGLNVFQSWYQGAIVNGRRTRGITEAVFIFLVSMGVMLFAGVRWGQVTGIYIGLAAFSISTLVQTAWLWYRSRPVLAAAEARDRAVQKVQVFEAVSD